MEAMRCLHKAVTPVVAFIGMKNMLILPYEDGNQVRENIGVKHTPYPAIEFEPPKFLI